MDLSSLLYSILFIQSMKLFYHLLAFMTLGLLAGACSDDNTTEPVHEHAEFAFFHAAAGGPSVDVRVDGTDAISDRTFSIIHDGYTELEAGERTITAVVRGGSAIVADTFDFAEDEHYTVFLTKDMTDNFGLLRFHDDLSHPPAGKALIRIAHLIPDGPTVKMAVPGSGQGPLFNNVKFTDNTEIFTPIDAGDVSLRVQDVNTSGGGGGGGGGGTLGIFDDVAVTLEAGKLYTIVLVGRIADNTATAVVLTHEHE